MLALRNSFLKVPFLFPEIAMVKCFWRAAHFIKYNCRNSQWSCTKQREQNQQPTC